MPAAVLGVVLTGCAAVGGDYSPPDPQVPAQWQGAEVDSGRDDAVLARWWREFDDPVLEGLVGDALAANKDLKSALAGLREARARRDLARSTLAPSLSASATARRSEATEEFGGGARELYNAAFDAAWEPDVFGAGRRGLEAAEAELQTSLAVLRDTRVSLLAEVARNYVELRTGETRLAIAEANLEAQQELFDLIRWRREAGLVSQLDESQALTLLEQTRANLPLLRTAISEARHRLDILLGRPPGQPDRRLRATGAIPAGDLRVAIGIPADTLRQRPDVRAAERRLAAQTARLGAARAERYPSFRLTGSVGLEALDPGGLFGGGAGTGSLLGAVTAPVFDAGRIRASIEVQDARLEQARLAYESAVLNALVEVEDALGLLANTGQRRRELALAVDSARRTLAYARQQYSSGLADFQAVLDSQRTLLNVEDQLAVSTGNQSTALIQLYKALGGGWEPGSHTQRGDKVL